MTRELGPAARLAGFAAALVVVFVAAFGVGTLAHDGDAPTDGGDRTTTVVSTHDTHSGPDNTQSHEEGDG